MDQNNQSKQFHLNHTIEIFKSDNSKKTGKPLIDDLIDAARIGNNAINMNVNNDIEINERLKMERKRAIQALQYSRQSCSTAANAHNNNNNNNSKSNGKPAGQIGGNKENCKSGHMFNSNNNTSEFNRTEYVPYCRNDSINISDLVTDKTIHLENMTPERQFNDVNFEPIEITGRSTQYYGNNNNNNNNNHNNKINKNVSDKYLKVPRGGRQKSKVMSVSEILATSFAPKARNLCETLKSFNSSATDTSMESHFLLDDYNDSRNLLHTADLSLLRHSNSKDRDTNDFFKFKPANNSQTIDDHNVSASDDFIPGELMSSKLLSDEISWAHQYATIPTKVLSNEAKQKVKQTTTIENGNSFGLAAISHSTLLSEYDVSMGSFFNKRSDNISNIIQPKSSTLRKCREESILSNNDGNDYDDDELTPKVNSKTYTRMSFNDTLMQLDDNDKSYAESLSALERALSQLNLESEIDKGIKTSKIPSTALATATLEQQPTTSSEAAAITEHNVLNVPKDLLLNKTISFNANILRDILLENKENINPESDKCKGTDNNNDDDDENHDGNNDPSRMNGDDVKITQINALQSRSPLSPLSINGTMMEMAANGGSVSSGGIQILTNNTNHERSLNDCRNLKKNTIPKNVKDVNSLIDPNDTKVAATTTTTKPFNSTRLELKKYDNSDSGIRISPNLTQNSEAAATNTDNKDCCPSSNSNGNGNGNGKSSGVLNVPTVVIREDSPTSFVEDISPIASPNNESPDARQKSPANSVASSGCTCRSGGTVVSSISQCSSTSEFCFRDGKPLPFKVTTTELSWLSTKLRTDSKKSFQIKNTSNKRVTLRLEIYGPGFQLVNNQRSSNVLTLHSQECRTITINFCPTVQGVAIGWVAFYTPNNKPQATSSLSSSLLEIPLYGYGGHARIQLTGILKGPIGSPYLPMGQLYDLRHGPLERHITLYNRGPLQAFAFINIDSVGLLIQRLGEAFNIYPQKVIIPPGGTVKIHLIFHPKRDDIKKIAKKMTDVFTVANLRVIYGDEVGRQRIKRLMKKMTEMQHSHISTRLFHGLWSTFPDEIPIIDLNDINECSDVAMDLLSNMHIHEIAITIEHHDIDETQMETSSFLSEADETILFRTICVPSQTNEQKEEKKLENVEGEQIARRIGEWSIEPKLLNINLQKNDKNACICIYSNYKSSKHFTVTCNFKGDAIQFHPNEGYIPPGHSKIIVNVTYKSHLQMDLTENIILTITVENESITIPVNILP